MAAKRCTLSENLRRRITAGSNLTAEDIYAHTAITYPAAYRTEMTGAQLREILEDVAESLFHPDPYAQQGGDMVRSAGLSYPLDVGDATGRRIHDLRLSRAGTPLEATRRCTVAGWGSINENIEGPSSVGCHLPPPCCQPRAAAGAAQRGQVARGLSVPSTWQAQRQRLGLLPKEQIALMAGDAADLGADGRLNEAGGDAPLTQEARFRWQAGGDIHAPPGRAAAEIGQVPGPLPDLPQPAAAMGAVLPVPGERVAAPLGALGLNVNGVLPNGRAI